MISRLLLLPVALTAGLAGGLISNWFVPHVAHAQNQEIPNQVWAHEFVLADKAGTAVEVIGIEQDGKASIEFLKKNDDVQAVRFNGNIYVLHRPRHPTLLPIKP